MKKSELLQFSESELQEIAKAYGIDIRGKNQNEIAELLADEPDSDSSENSSPESTTSETKKNQVKDKVEEKQKDNNNIEIEKLRQENSELKEKIKKFEWDNHSLQLRLELTISENNKFKKQKEEIEELHEKQLRKNSDLEMQIVKLEGIIEEYKNTFPVNDKIKKLRKEIEEEFEIKYQSDIDYYLQQIEELKKFDIRRIIIRRKEMQEKEKELIQKKSEIEQELQEIEKEKSEFKEIEKLVSEIETDSRPGPDDNPDDTPTGTDSPGNKNPDSSGNNNSSTSDSTPSVNNSIKSSTESATKQAAKQVIEEPIASKSHKKNNRKSDNFKEYIQLVKRLKVDKELPILKNVLIEYNREEKSIKLIATNLNIFLESPIFTLSEIPGNIESGKYLILIDLLKKCKTPDDIFKYIDITTSVDDFPVTIENRKTNTVTIKDFSLEEIYYKIAKNEDNREILQSFVIDTENKNFVSTDAKRLIYKNIEIKECDYAGKIIFPEELAKILQKSFYSEVQIKIQENNYAKIILSNDIKIYSRIKDGNYPNYLQVIPVSFSKTIEIEKSVILEAIENRKAELIQQGKKKKEIAMETFIIEIDNNIYGKFCIKYMEQILIEAKESVKVLYNKDYIEKEGKNYLNSVINIQVNNLNYIIIPACIA